MAQVLCPGSQNDISVYGDLLFLSTDSSRSDDSCNSTAQPATVKASWEGIKIFDISDKAQPAVHQVRRDGLRLAHPHPGARRKDRSVYLYVSSYRPTPTFPDCQPPHDSISIIKVPLQEADRRRRWWRPRTSSRTAATTAATTGSATSGCHDITVYPAKDLAAGACMGDGVLLDITDPRGTPRSSTGSGTRQLRVLALGDVQQRRHQGRLHRRARRRRRGHLQRGRSARTAAPTPSTTSSARATTASWSSAATTRSPATRPTPRTASRTTAR